MIKSVLNIYHTSFFFLNLIALSFSSHICNLNITLYLRRQVNNNGLHRNIEFEYDIINHSKVKKLFILSIEHFPSSIYVDPYELERMSGYGVPNIFIPDKINIEAPAYKSMPVDIFIFLESQESYIKTVLPIHLRYAKAHNCSMYGYSVKVRLKLPAVFVRFDEIDINSCENTIKAPCDINGINCSWIPARIFYNTSDLLFDVPTGCIEHRNMVTIITFLVIAFGTFSLIRTLLQKSNELEKLE